MLKGHLPRVIYHRVYWYTKKKRTAFECRVQGSGFRVERLSSGLGVEFGFAVHVWVHYVGQGFGAWGAGFRLYGLLFRVGGVGSVRVASDARRMYGRLAEPGHRQ